MAKKMFNVGKIVNTHGIRGELKVKRISDFDERFAVGETLYIRSNKSDPIPLKIAAHRVHKGFDILGFEEFNNINDVEKYKNCYLQIAEEQLTELDTNEYYYHEIIGCKVYTISGEFIGTIREILAPGANDVWVVKRKEEKDALIPYIEQVVKEVNIDKKRIEIDPMEGLLD